jgi:hypothetical protein
LPGNALPGNVIRMTNPRASGSATRAPMPRQQRIVGRLNRVLAAVAEPRGWDVLGSVAVRVRPRISCYPDLVICERAGHAAKSIKADAAALVVAVESPWSRGIGRREQRWAYAEAGIKAFWYIELVGSRPPTLCCYLLTSRGYVRQAVVQTGNPQWVTLPIGVDVRLDVDELDH